MLKKIVLGAVLAATASFATWDYYPVQDAGKASFRGGFYYDADHHWSQAGMRVGARFSLIKGLEISLLNFGYQFWGETDLNGYANGGNGLLDLALGVRFEIAPMITAFADVNLPTGRDEYDGLGTTSPSSDELSLYVGAQFSLPTGVKGFDFGIESGFFWGFEHDGHERGLDIHAGVEARYIIPTIQELIPYVGLKMKYRLTESEYEAHDGHDYGYNDDGTTQFNLWLGAEFKISPMISMKSHLIFRNEDYNGHKDDGNPRRMDGDATGIYIGCEIFL